MLTALIPALFWPNVCALSFALAPVIKPASAAPANKAFIELLILIAPFTSLICESCAATLVFRRSSHLF
jgi:hypothetical protein